MNALKSTDVGQVQTMLSFIMGRGNRPLCQPPQ